MGALANRLGPADLWFFNPVIFFSPDLGLSMTTITGAGS
jgi:hypothetical protein